jgi:hypothetical protein
MENKQYILIIFWVPFVSKLMALLKYININNTLLLFKYILSNYINQIAKVAEILLN